MRLLAICYRGLEKNTQKEIRLLTGIESECEEGAVIFETDEVKKAAKICYKAQSPQRAMILLDEYELGKEDISGLDLSAFLKKTYVVRCIKTEADIERMEIEQELGAQIKRKYSVTVDYKHPETTFLAYVFKDKVYFGIDLIGFDLAKRDYRIQQSSMSLKGPVYFNFLMFAGYNPDKTLLDFFTTDGSIAIEAAAFSTGKSINFYRKDSFLLRDSFDISLDDLDKDEDIKKKIFCFGDTNALRKAKNNSKVAGLNKQINFGTVRPADLDVKFSEGEIDIIASLPLQCSRYSNERKIASFYDEMFYQAEHILSKAGAIALIALNEKTAEMIQESAKRKGFSEIDNIQIKIGESRITFLKLKKKQV